MPTEKINVACTSGGRTSAYMAIKLYEQGFKGIYCFQNTGMEAPETIEFLKNMPFPIVVLQYTSRKPFFTVETLDTLDMTGKPFRELVAKRKRLPNRARRFCSAEMKVLTLRRYMRSIGHNHYNTYIGIRADEAHRKTVVTENAIKSSGKRVSNTPYFPLIDDNITSRDIYSYWHAHDFDLNLPMLPNGKTICGNCIGCFMKSEAELAIMLKRYPEKYKLMEDLELNSGNTLKDNISLVEIRERVEKDLQFDFNINNEVYCTTEIGGCS